MRNDFFLLKSLRNSALLRPDQKLQFLAAMRLHLSDQVSPELLNEMADVITPLLDDGQFSIATIILSYWIKTEEERAKALEEIAKKECSVETNAATRHYQYFKTFWGIVLFFEKLITPEQLSLLPCYFCYHCLFSQRGILTLRKGLLTPEQIIRMPDPYLLHSILSENGIDALTNETYTFKELASLPSSQHVECMTTPLAQKAYKEGLLTLENVSSIPENYVFRPINSLLNKWGIQLLREKFLTWNNLSTINIYWLKEICSERGLEAFRKVYIDIEYIKNNTTQLNAILTKGCITAFDKGYFTPQQISGLSSDFIFSLTSKNALIAFEEGTVSFDEIMKSGINESTLSCAVSEFGREIVRHTSLEEFAQLPVVNAREFTNYFGAELVTKFSVTLNQIKQLEGYWQTRLVASETGVKQIQVEPDFINRIIANPWGYHKNATADVNSPRYALL